jgi:hypothetical protein
MCAVRHDSPFFTSFSRGLLRSFIESGEYLIMPLPGVVMHPALSIVETTWKDLLHGGEDSAEPWIASTDRRAVPFCAATILAGVGLYGASIGAWQGPLLGLYVAIKLPFVIFLTLLVNALLNGVLAQVLGVRLGIRQTTLALLAAFAVFALIVGSLSPITLGMVLDAPAPDSPRGELTHRRLLVIHTGIIALAGIISTGRLHRHLLRHSESTAAARRGLIALLTGNLFAGAQVGFLLRPIFGQPGLEIQFLRPDLFEGNFYESVWWALQHSF